MRMRENERGRTRMREDGRMGMRLRGCERGRTGDVRMREDVMMRQDVRMRADEDARE